MHKPNIYIYIYPNQISISNTQISKSHIHKYPKKHPITNTTYCFTNPTLKATAQYFKYNIHTHPKMHYHNTHIHKHNHYKSLNPPKHTSSTQPFKYLCPSHSIHLYFTTIISNKNYALILTQTYT